jgi:hypothetical protein
MFASEIFFGGGTIRTERTLKDGFAALVDFLDTDGAFYNTPFGPICRASEEHGVEHNAVRCIYAMHSIRPVLATQILCMMRASWWLMES